jgi:hypothetical protein
MRVERETEWRGHTTFPVKERTDLRAGSDTGFPVKRTFEGFLWSGTESMGVRTGERTDRFDWRFRHRENVKTGHDRSLDQLIERWRHTHHVSGEIGDRGGPHPENGCNKYSGIVCLGMIV